MTAEKSAVTLIESEPYELPVIQDIDAYGSATGEDEAEVRTLTPIRAVRRAADGLHIAAETEDGPLVLRLAALDGARRAAQPGRIAGA